METIIAVVVFLTLVFLIYQQYLQMDDSYKRRMRERAAKEPDKADES